LIACGRPFPAAGKIAGTSFQLRSEASASYGRQKERHAIAGLPRMDLPGENSGTAAIAEGRA